MGLDRLRKNKSSIGYKKYIHDFNKLCGDFTIPGYVQELNVGIDVVKIEKDFNDSEHLEKYKMEILDFIDPKELVISSKSAVLKNGKSCKPKVVFVQNKLNADGQSDFQNVLDALKVFSYLMTKGKITARACHDLRNKYFDTLSYE